MTNKINEFVGEYYFLSNFFEIPVSYNGLTYKNSEAAFHAQKDVLRAKDFIFLNAAESKKLGRRVNLRTDWEQVKDQIMYEVVKAKFSNNKMLKAKLLATGDAYLEEGTKWHDNYWGNCSCPKCIKIEGKNKLGQILMKVREELKNGI